MTFSTYFTDASIANGTGITASNAGTSSSINLTVPVSVAHGGTNATSVPTAPTASAFAAWDANSNLSANNIIEGYQSTATANATTTLTVASAEQQFFTGSNNQTILMPSASTLALGQSWTITNLSSAAITVESSGSIVIQVVAPNAYVTVTCILLSGTGNKSWNWVYSAFEPTSLNALSLAGNPTGGSALPESVGLVANQLAFSGTNLGLDPQISVVLADVVLGPTDVNGMFAAPVQILPALALGTMYFIDNVQFIFSAVSTSVAGGDVYLQYGSGSAAVISDAVQTRFPVAYFIAARANTGINATWTLNGSASLDNTNFTDNNIANGGVGIYLTNATAPFTGSAGITLDVIIKGYIYSPKV